jgi:filamentous hemagglutinin family protein
MDMEHRYSTSQRVIATLTAYSFIFYNIFSVRLIYADQIIPDGRTQTNLSIQGNVTDITTSTIRGINAYNSFDKFNVNTGNIANLHVPGSANNLLNLVHGQASSIDGVLNAYKNGSIGGNVFFANPHGIVVGASGVVNVGSLAMSTPTANFMSGFFDAAGNPTDVSTNQLLNGTAPINGNALISIRGRVNALDTVVLQAGDVINAGVINAGTAAAQSIRFSDLVNTDNLQTGAGIVEENGEIYIMAENDFTNTGQINADGANNIDAGNIVVTAKNDIILSGDSSITAKGQGENSNGGNVIVFADNNSALKDNATLDVSGGDISGDGGFVEFSAKDTVELGGGSLRAGAVNGELGTILIDPLNVNITEDLLRDSSPAGGVANDSKGSTWNAGNLILEADEKITISASKVVSTRQVGSNTVAAHINDDSTGDSGNLTLNAKEIELQTGAMLLAHVEDLSNFNAGDVTFNATSKDHTGLLIADAVSSIVIDGATIKANDITLTSSSDAAYSWGGDTDDLLVGLIPTSERAYLTQLTGVNVGLAMAEGTSSVTLKSGSLLQAAGTVTLDSQSKAAASTYTIAKPAANAGAYAVGFIYGETTAHSTVDVQSGATINAQKLDIDARNTADLNLNVYSISTSNSANAAVAIGNADVKSEAKIAAGANINVSDEVSIDAINNNRLKVASSAMAIEAGKAGLSTSFLLAENSATAYTNADINTAGFNSLTVHAQDNNVLNRVTSSADSGSGLASKKYSKYVNGANAAANKITSKFLETKNPAPGATAKPKFAGALSYADSKQTANASIGDNATVVASKDVSVTAKVEDARIQNHAQSAVESEVDDPTPENPSATIGVSVAVAYGDYTHNADAHVGDNANVTAQHVGVRSDVLMPWEQTWWKWEGLNTFISKLNGNVGVANGFLTGYANAQSAANNVALAGAVTYLDFNNNSKAYLGKSTSITVLPGGSNSWVSHRTDAIEQFVPVTDIDPLQDPACALTFGCNKLKFVEEDVNWSSAVNVIANNEIEGVFSSGNLGLTLAGTQGENGGKSVGASFNQIDYTNVTQAFIAEGAVVKQQAASPAIDINVLATSRENMIVASPTAGRGASFGLNGQVSIASINNTTEASIDDEAQITADNLQIKAADEIVTWSLSGAFNMSDTAAVGMAVAYTDVTSKTNAFVGDNDNNFIAGSTLVLANGELNASDIDLTARTDGKIESISVAATLAKSDGKPPLVVGGKTFDQKAAEAKTASRLDKAIKSIKDKLNKVPSNKKSWIAPPESKPQFGLGVSGAASVNVSDLDTNAYINHPKVTGVGALSSLNISAVNDTDITAAAGSAALTRANAPSSKRSAAFAGAVTVNIVDNDTSAYIEDSVVTHVKDVNLLALEGGEQLSVAIGAAVNASADKNKAASVAGSVSISQTDNSVNAYIKNSTVLGNNDGADRGNMNIIAYDRTKLGTGAGSLFAGGKSGFGAAVTYSDIDNMVNAYIDNSIIADLVADHGGFENIQIKAFTAAKIASGGGMLGVTTGSKGGSLAGAVVVNDINNITSADIKGNSTVIATNTVDVLARDINAVASLDAVIDSEDNGNANASSLDYDGTSIGLAVPSGSSILAVAGVVQLGLGGSGNVGASITRNTISNKFNARITNSVVKTQIKLLPGMADPTGATTDPAIVSATPVVTGNINVIARSDAKITAIAVGVGFAEDEFAGAGSATTNEIENEVQAEISSTSIQKISTNNLALTAEDESKIESLAGQVTISTGDTAIGLSLAHNEINNKVFSSVTGVDIDARLSTDVKAVNASTIRTLSATAGGAKSFAFNGAVSIGLIGNETEAKIVDSKSDTNKNKTIVWAKDRSKIEALSGGAAVATKGAGVGIAVAVNRIAGSTKAHVSGSALNSAYNLEHLRIWSDSQASINTISVGIGGGKDVGLGGSITTNFINNDVLSYIDDGAKVVAQNYVGVTTDSDDRLTVAAGSAGVGLASAGIGVSFAYNSIKGSAKAYIDGTNTGTEVTAYGKDPADSSYGYLITNTGLLNSSVNLANAVDLENYNKLDLRSLKETELVRGIAVNASSTQHVESIGANLAAGANGYGLVTTINSIAGNTDAYIQNTSINGGSNTDGTLNQSVNVIASNHAYGNGFVGNLSIGFSGSAAGAAVDTHNIARHTRAFINGGVLAAKGDLKVKAYTTQGVSSLAVGGAGGAGLAIAGTLAYANFVNTTEAFISHADVTADEVTVEADNENNLHLVAGAVSIGGNAGGGAFTVGLNESKTNAYILGSDYDAYRTKVKTTGAINVAANAKTNIGHTAVAGAAAGSIGVAGSVSVNILNGTTQAYIKQADVGTDINRVGQVTVSAKDEVALDTDAGSVAIGGTAGVGASVAVNILKSRVTSTIDDSTVYSSQSVDVTSTSKNNINALTFSGGGGGSVGISGAVVVNMVGSDVVDTARGGDEANDEAGGTIKGVDDAVGDVGDTVIDDILPDSDAVMTASERTEMKSNTSADVKDISYGADAAAAKYQTSANVLGANSLIDAVSLNVEATDSTSTKSTVGGVAVGGGLGLGAGVGVTKVQANVISRIGSGVDVNTANNIDVKATAKKDTGEVINILAFAGAGGLVGLGAAVAVADVDNKVTADNDGDTDSISGTVNVEAKDSSNMLIESIGAVAGAAAAGAVIARASKTSVVTASSGAPTVNAAGASIIAKSEGQIIARTQSAAGGLAGAGNGADARAKDNSTVLATTADSSVFNLGNGSLSVEAEASPQTDALSQGVTVSGGLSIGVSIAKAEANTNVTASLGSNNEINAGDLTVAAKQTLGSAASSASRILNVVVDTCTSNCDSARANAFAAGGGLLAGIGATTGKAESIGVISSTVGDNSVLNITGTSTVEANSITKSNSTVTGITIGGYAAAGSNTSDANSDMHTTAALGDNVKVVATNLNINATGSDNNYAQATSGSGGLYSGVATAADTSSKSVTRAVTGSGSIAQGINVATLNVDASHTTTFNGKVNNLSASAVGASGADSTHLVESTVESNIADNAWVLANRVDVKADNITRKPYLAGGSWNLNSASGGLLLDVPGANSNSVIKHWSKANIGSNARVQIIEPVATVDAVLMNVLNDIQAYDKVKVNSGGAAAVPYAGSTIDIQVADAEVKFGAGSAVISDKGDIKAGARSKVDLKTETVVDAYGIAGAPSGKAYSKYNGHNKVTVETGTTNTTTIRTDNGSIILAAGEDTNGAANDLDLVAKVNLWNKTAIPIPTPPDALVVVANNNTVAIKDNALVESEKDIGLFANGGSVFTQAKGIGKDIYREALAATASAVSNAFGGGDVSFEIKGGEEIVSGVGTVSVTGSGKVRTGIKRIKSLTLDILPGSVTGLVPGGVVVASDDSLILDKKEEGIAENLQNRIDRLRELETQYAGTPAGAAYTSEIKFLEKKLVDLGLATADNPGTLGTDGISPYQSALNQKNQLQQIQTGLESDRASHVAVQTARTSDKQVFIDKRNYVDLKTTEANKQNPDQNLIDTYDAEIVRLDGVISTNSLVEADIDSSLVSLTESIGNLDADIGIIGDQLVTLQIRIDEVNTDPDAGPTALSRAAITGPRAEFWTVDDISVRLGSIDIKADVLSGDGHLVSPGDAKIQITNNTPTFLNINKLTIDSNVGGIIKFNGIGVIDKVNINALNGLNSTAAQFSTIESKDSFGAAIPEITIDNLYNPDDPSFVAKGPAPDINLNADIYNPRGLVRVFNQAGSILIGEGADVFAGTVEIEAQNGDFVQSYTDNFFHAGGDPASIYEDRNDPNGVKPGGIVANGSVFIAARYLNINGLIQSGIERWDIDLESDPLMTGSAADLGVDPDLIKQYKTDYSNNKALTTFSLTNDRGQNVTYNAVEDRLEMNLASVRADFDGVVGENDRKANGLYRMILPQDEKDINYVATIGANYDVGNDRYELNGIEVYGGYIQLYGQIMNTSSSGAGILKVLDGYGTINVRNPTSRDVVINKLNTGRGVAGVIDITDIQFLSGNVPYSINTHITRENGVVNTARKVVFDSYTGPTTTNTSTGVTTSAGTEIAYDPQTALRYQWDNGNDFSQTTYYRKEALAFFDSNSLEAASTLSNQVGLPVRSPGTPLDEGRILLFDPTLVDVEHDEVGPVTVSLNTPKISTPVRKSSCNWWTLCAASDVVTTWNVTQGGKEITTNTLKADYPIRVVFSGEEAGGVINVISSGGGDILLQGGITNKEGATTIANNAGSILQYNEDALITSKQLDLVASGDIGNLDPVKHIQSGSNGLFEASAANGNINVNHVVGNIILGNVAANVGTVMLSSDGDITQSSSANRLVGRRIELDSINGGIGTDTRALMIETGYTDDLGEVRRNYGLNASARDTINIRSVANASSADNADGDLLVDRVVSLAGDVTLAADGSILDNNLVEEIDQRAWDDLLDYWKDTQLLRDSAENEAKQANEVKVFVEDPITENYFSYWQIRQQQADGGIVYNPDFSFVATASQRSVLMAQFTESGISIADIPAKITEYEKQRTSDYHSLHAEVSALNGGVYSEKYRYVSSATERENFLTTFRKGSSWTERELGISVSSGLKEITDTNPVVKEANIVGRNVTLISGSDIGTTLAGTEISTTIDPEFLTDTQKVALASAERSDFQSLNNDTLIRILHRKSVNVDVGDNGIFTAVSSGNAYIGSEQSIRLNTVDATDEVRIKVGESILNSNTQDGPDNYNIKGSSTILEAANGAIGEAANPIRLMLDNDASLTARAKGNIFIEELVGNINVDGIYTPKELTLITPGSILDALKVAPEMDELNIRSASLITIVGDSIGEQNNPLEIGLDATSNFDAKVPGDVYLASPFAPLNIGDISAGGEAVLSGLSINVDKVQSATGNIFLFADQSISNANMAGEVNLMGNDITLTAVKGMIGDPSKKLVADSTGDTSLSAEKGIYYEERNGDLRLADVKTADTSMITSAGDILLVQSANLRSTGGTLALEATGSILDETGFGLIDAVGLSLQANNGSIGSQQTSLLVDTDSISLLSASKGIYLTETRGDLNIAKIINGNGDVLLHVADPGAWLNISEGVVDGRMLWTADNMMVENLVHGGNEEVLYFEVTSSTGGMAEDVTIKYQSDNKVRFGNFEAERATVLGDVDDLRFERILTGEWAVFANDTTSVYVDNVNGGLRKEHTIQLTNMDEPYFLYFTPNMLKIETDADALYYDEDWIVNDFSTENSVSRLVEKDLAYLTGPIPSVLNQAQQPDDSDIVETELDDVLNLQSTDDSELFLPLYWSDI